MTHSNILLHIFSFLPYNDFCRLSEVSTTIADLLSTQNDQRDRRPRLNTVRWQDTRSYIGEQLRIMGFFAGKTDFVDPDLKLKQVPNQKNRDIYNSICICDKNRVELVDIDIRFLNDFVNRGRPFR
jgi:hypothetical protein